MKLRAERNEFVEAITWAGRTIASRPALPAMAGILLEAGDGWLVARSTDLELSSEIRVRVQVDEPGTALLPGRLLGQIASRLPEAPVTVEGPPDRIAITCGRARFAVRGMQTDDFPRIPDPAEDAGRGTVSTTAFVRLVSQVTRAASTDEARLVLTGVKLEATKDGLTAAATDSYRLALRTIPWDKGAETEALVPARALQEAAKAIPDSVDELEISFEEGQVSFLFADRRLQTSLVQGSFPNYRQLLPDECETRVIADRADLVEALQRVAVVALGQVNTPVVMSFSDGTLEMSADTQEIGEASEALPVEIEGEGLQIAFNPMFLLSGLEGMATDQVEIQLRDGLKPAVVRPHGDGADDGIYLLMPVKTN